MYAILAEDNSDVEVLKTLIRRICETNNIRHFTQRGKGYSGCSEMIRKGARDLRHYQHHQKCTKFVICYDADHDLPEDRVRRVQAEIVEKSGIDPKNTCIVIPTQEIESWMLCDTSAIKKVLTAWKGDIKNVLHPESIKDPKEHLQRLSKRHGKPLYVHAVHNPKVAQHLDLTLLWNKCPSYRPLADFVISKK